MNWNNVKTAISAMSETELSKTVEVELVTKEGQTQTLPVDHLTAGKLVVKES